MKWFTTALLLMHSYITPISGIIVLRLNSALTAVYRDIYSLYIERQQDIANIPAYIRQENTPSFISYILTAGDYIEPGRSRNTIYIRAMQKAL